MTHMFTWLYGDRGIPASFRTMDGFSHSFQWVTAKGEASWVEYHFKTDPGDRVPDFGGSGYAHRGSGPGLSRARSFSAINRGDYPSWTLKMQIMPVAEAAKYRFYPLM